MQARRSAEGGVEAVADASRRATASARTRTPPRQRSTRRRSPTPRPCAWSQGLLLRDGEIPDGPPRTRSQSRRKRGGNSTKTKRARGGRRVGDARRRLDPAADVKDALSARRPAAEARRCERESGHARSESQHAGGSHDAGRQSQDSRAPCLAKTSDGDHFAMPYAGFGEEAIGRFAPGAIQGDAEYVRVGLIWRKAADRGRGVD